ncbi:MAG: hypothetical protein JRJ27_04735 [Deltaproteobacteria bacterium]|nr:hypothetical protein [Deltaproteobacteria bacterium]
MNITSPNTYPEVALIQQRLQASKLEDLPRAVMDSLNGLPVLKMTTPGDTVAVAVGSRGINHYRSACLC